MAAQFPDLVQSDVPDRSTLHRAQRYLQGAHDAVSNMLNVTYPALRSQREGKRGRLTHAEHDCFRAAVVFAAAGVDTVFKEAIRCAVPNLVDLFDLARDKYLEFVTTYIKEGSGVSPRAIAGLLADKDSGSRLVEEYIQQLTGSSLQSVGQITMALSALGLGDEKDLYIAAKQQRKLFEVRHQIAHELDMTQASARGKGKRSRHERTPGAYHSLCLDGLNYSQTVLNRLHPTLA